MTSSSLLPDALLHLSPHEITFRGPFDEWVFKYVKLTNTLQDKRLVFKFRSNCMDNFTVRPVYGIIEEGHTIYVKMTSRPLNANLLSPKHKFTVIVGLLPSHADTPGTAKAIWVPNQPWTPTKTRTIQLPVRYVEEEGIVHGGAVKQGIMVCQTVLDSADEGEKECSTKGKIHDLVERRVDEEGSAADAQGKVVRDASKEDPAAVNAHLGRGPPTPSPTSKTLLESKIEQKTPPQAKTPKQTGTSPPKSPSNNMVCDNGKQLKIVKGNLMAMKSNDGEAETRNTPPSTYAGGLKVEGGGSAYGM